MPSALVTRYLAKLHTSCIKSNMDGDQTLDHCLGGRPHRRAQGSNFTSGAFARGAVRDGEADACGTSAKGIVEETLREFTQRRGALDVMVMADRLRDTRKQ